MPRAAGRPPLPQEDAERVRDLLRKLRDERYSGNASLLADALGLTQSALSQLLAGRNRASLETIRAVAVLLRVDPGDVLRGEIPPEDTYPERASALWRLRGILPPEVVEQVRSVLVHDAEPLTESEWLELAISRLRDHERAAELARRTRNVLPRH